MINKQKTHKCFMCFFWTNFYKKGNKFMEKVTTEDMGIRVIFGKFGKGKGTLNSIFAVGEMKDIQRYRNCLASIKYLEKKLGRPFTNPPQEHTVYANFDLKYKLKERYEFDPDRFMLPNEENDFDIYPPYSCFHVEEGQSGTFCSYDWSKFPKAALLAFARVRHPHYLFTIDLQFLNNLNKNLRRFAFEYLTPLNIENKKNCLNILCETKVLVGVFTSYERAETFEETQDLELVEEFRVYKHDGNIYRCFDSHSKLLDFFEVDKNKDFSYDLSKCISKLKNNSIQEIII